MPGLLLAALAERSARDSLQRVIGQQLAREAGHTAERLSTVLRTEMETLASFARQDLMREVRVADIDKRVSMALTTLRSGSPMRRDYLVVEPGRGVVAASAPGLIGSLPAWLDPGWLAASASGGVFGPVSLPGSGPPSLVMTTAIRDPDDGRRTLGTLVGLLDWERLTTVTGDVRRDLDAQGIAADVLVTGEGGAVIGGARAPGAGAGAGRPLPDLFDVATGASPEEPDYTVDPRGGLIIGRASLALDPALGRAWTLLVVQPRAQALAPARDLSLRLVLTMGLAVAGALAVATLAARRVVRPLDELTRAIRGLSRAGEGVRRVPVRSEDEVGTLAEAFNEMSSQLDRTQRELVEAEKFAFVGELASGVAHEIRTSLGVLGTSAQILERSLPREARGDAAELAEMIRAEVGRLSGVVNDLLTLDRARPLALEVAPVSEPVLRALDFVAPQAQEQGIELLRPDAEREAAVVCEPELVYQVAVNLLVNAVQVLGPGGRVEVRILEARDGYGGFEVRDDGPGIPEAHRERIFQPFVSARKGGVGLGLTFVKRVVHDHRGRIAVESELGRGTCIRIELPTPDPER